jgi:hypothetical protein
LGGGASDRLRSMDAIDAISPYIWVNIEGLLSLAVVSRAHESTFCSKCTVLGAVIGISQSPIIIYKHSARIRRYSIETGASLATTKLEVLNLCNTDWKMQILSCGVSYDCGLMQER